ncbi:MAG: cysteine-rich repeat protein [Myxococcota bacterium]|jgi:cysteine-rich repeat protein
MHLLLALLGCSDEPVADEILAACGNSIVEADEQCDDGASNSDDTADACRASCRLPSCGDGVTDAGEACDDGDAWGGDGCLPSCVTEDGALEEEPNDAWDASQPLSDAPVQGALPSGDIDCYSFSVGECETISAELSGDCSDPVTLSLHDPAGALVAASARDADGCATIDPVEEPGARFAAAGQWAVCAAPLVGGEVTAYTLTATSGDSSEHDLPLTTSEDADGDGLIDDCDGDRDGDGLDNDDDNCPDLPNGPDNIAPTVDSSGFIRHWLAAGPFTGESSPSGCLPSYTERTGDDAATAPALGDEADGLRWAVHIATSSLLELTADYASVGAPREVYAATYLYSDSTRDVTLGLGPDDGARAWLNGVVVLEVTGCQGVSRDQFTADVTLEAGWNRLMVKIYDQGGGWGTYVRFLDGDGDPITDLELSLSPDGPWGFDQTDSDGDGVGDACDDD